MLKKILFVPTLMAAMASMSATACAYNVTSHITLDHKTCTTKMTPMGPEFAKFIENGGWANPNCVLQANGTYITKAKHDANVKAQQAKKKVAKEKKKAEQAKKVVQTKQSTPIKANGVNTAGKPIHLPKLPASANKAQSVEDAIKQAQQAAKK